MSVIHKQSRAIAEVLYKLEDLDDGIELKPLKRYLVVVVMPNGWHQEGDIVIWREGAFRHA